MPTCLEQLRHTLQPGIDQLEQSFNAHNKVETFLKLCEEYQTHSDFDPLDQARWAALDELFPPSVLASIDKDIEQAVVETTRPRKSKKEKEGTYEEDHKRKKPPERVTRLRTLMRDEAWSLRPHQLVRDLGWDVFHCTRALHDFYKAAQKIPGQAVPCWEQVVAAVKAESEKRMAHPEPGKYLRSSVLQRNDILNAQSQFFQSVSTILPEATTQAAHEHDEPSVANSTRKRKADTEGQWNTGSGKAFHRGKRTVLPDSPSSFHFHRKADLVDEAHSLPGPSHSPGSIRDALRRKRQHGKAGFFASHGDVSPSTPVIESTLDNDDTAMLSDSPLASRPGGASNQPRQPHSIQPETGSSTLETFPSPTEDHAQGSFVTSMGPDLFPYAIEDEEIRAGSLIADTETGAPIMCASPSPPASPYLAISGTDVPSLSHNTAAKASPTTSTASVAADCEFQHSTDAMLTPDQACAPAPRRQRHVTPAVVAALLRVDLPDGQRPPETTTRGMLQSLQPGMWLSSATLAPAISAFSPHPPTLKVCDAGYLARDKASTTPISSALRYYCPMYLNGHWKLATIDASNATYEIFDSAFKVTEDDHAVVRDFAGQVTSDRELVTIAAPLLRQVSEYDCGIYVIVRAVMHMQNVPCPSNIIPDIWRRVLIVYFSGSAACDYFSPRAIVQRLVYVEQRVAVIFKAKDELEVSCADALALADLVSCIHLLQEECQTALNCLDRRYNANVMLDWLQETKQRLPDLGSINPTTFDLESKEIDRKIKAHQQLLDCEYEKNIETLRDVLEQDIQIYSRWEARVSSVALKAVEAEIDQRRRTKALLEEDIAIREDLSRTLTRGS